MVKVFLVVIDNPREGISISKFNDENHVISAIGQMEKVEVQRVFSVDEFGSVTHYNVVFKGRLKLEEVTF